MSGDPYRAYRWFMFGVLAVTAALLAAAAGTLCVVLVVRGR